MPIFWADGRTFSIQSMAVDLLTQIGKLSQFTMIRRRPSTLTLVRNYLYFQSKCPRNSSKIQICLKSKYFQKNLRIKCEFKQSRRIKGNINILLFFSKVQKGYCNLLTGIISPNGNSLYTNAMFGSLVGEESSEEKSRGEWLSFTLFEYF